LCEFRGRSIGFKKKIFLNPIPTDPNFKDHAIGNTHIFVVGLNLMDCI